MQIEQKPVGETHRTLEGRRLRAPFAAFLPRLAEETENLYKERLISLVLFGSVARAAATQESDVDFLIIASSFPIGRINRVSEFNDGEERLQPEIKKMEQEGFHPYLSPVFKTPAEVMAGSLLFLDMIFDAVILYDKDGFFETFLASFGERLDKLGARRIVQGDRWYWDLKPDYHIGEVFEI